MGENEDWRFQQIYDYETRTGKSLQVHEDLRQRLLLRRLIAGLETRQRIRNDRLLERLATSYRATENVNDIQERAESFAVWLNRIRRGTSEPTNKNGKRIEPITNSEGVEQWPRTR